MTEKKATNKKNYNHKAQKKGRPVNKVNIILVFLIIISLVILGSLYFEFNSNDPEPEPEPPIPQNQPPFPLPTQRIINTHDHIDFMDMLEKWLSSQRQCNVSATIMVGSPNSTFWSQPKGPFTHYLENNELLLDMAQMTNGEIIAFPTINPNDENNLERLKDYLARGARGLNLWTGHHGVLEGSWGALSLYDWLGPLNRTDMYPIYEYCQKNRIPVIWSNNLGIWEIREYLWSILERFPDMIIKIPHFGICFQDYNLPFIEQFLDNYTGVYTCFSWGHPEFVMEKFENISTVRNEAISEFFEKYQDRIMFGTDIVPTINKRKTVEWMRKHTQVYKDVLENENYHVEILNFTPDGIDFIADYRGLNLSKDILEKVYYKNAIKFLSGLAWNEELNETIITRGDGEALKDAWENSDIHIEEKRIRKAYCVGNHWWEGGTTTVLI